MPVKTAVENGMELFGKLEVVFAQQDLRQDYPRLDSTPNMVSIQNQVVGLDDRDLSAFVGELSGVAVQRKRCKPSHCLIVELKIAVLMRR